MAIKRVNIGIVVLNYLSYNVTIKCVNYLKKQIENKFVVKIIVVDNDSKNESFKILNDYFKNDQEVVVVKTPYNLGFAKGNNFGYKTLLKYMDPDFVIFSNSDAYAKQPKLFDWIVREYDESKFDVLGPSIYSVRGNFYQSPLENGTLSIKKLKKEKYELWKSIINLTIKKHLRLNISKGSKITKWHNNYYNRKCYDKTLHGAFQIFSKNYFKFYKEPYDPRTFLYREEYILKLRCLINNLKMEYSPDYTIQHLQAV